MFIDRPLCFVDIETTGGSPYKNRIIEIGIIRYENGQVTKTLNVLVNPYRPVSKFILDLTGISLDELQSALPFEEVAESIKEILSGSVFIAHNASFDYTFLRQEFSALGEVFKIDTLCSAKLSSALFPIYQRHNLDVIIERLNIRVLNRHRAYDDAYVLLKFFEKLHEEHDHKEVIGAIKNLLKSPNVPLYLDEKELDLLPKKPGVYVFYDEMGTPLFVNCARNIKSAVFDHFYGNSASNIDKKIAKTAHKIEYFAEIGYVSALISYKSLIKNLDPKYQEKSSDANVNEFYVVSAGKKLGYIDIKIIKTDNVQEVKRILRVFRSEKSAKDFIDKFIKANKLCLHFAGTTGALGDSNSNIDSTKDANNKDSSNGSNIKGINNTDNTPCFNYHIGICKGACIKKENANDYNLRVKLAIKEIKYKFPVYIREYDNETHNRCEYKIDAWVIVQKREFYGDEPVITPINIPIADEEYRAIMKLL